MTVTLGSVQGPILIIEDDAAIADAIASSLGEAGFTTEIVDDGLAALGRLRVEPQPVAVLLDLLIPSVDGYSVFTELRDNRRFQNVPIVVISSSTIIDRPLLTGAEAVLAKPRSTEAPHAWKAFLLELHAAIHRAIAAGPRGSAPPAT